MGFDYHNRCHVCRHEWAGTSSSARLITITRETIDRYLELCRLWICPGCHRSLTLPRAIESNSWRAWREGSNQGWLSPYLDKVVALVDACLAGSPPEVAVPIDVHPGDCPACRRPFLEGTGEDYVSPCPRCGDRAPEAVPGGSTGHSVLFMDEYGFG